LFESGAFAKTSAPAVGSFLITKSTWNQLIKELSFFSASQAVSVRFETNELMLSFILFLADVQTTLAHLLADVK